MSRLLPLLSLSVIVLSACSDPASDPEPTEAASESSELAATSCHGLVGTDATHYYVGQPNIARELAASVGPSFLRNGGAFIPGVLKASHSTSVYAYAATLELGAWSSMSTSSFDGAGVPASDGSLYVWVGGSTREDPKGYKASKALFNAMTKAVETSENGAIVRRSSLGSATCAKYTDSYQCVLGPFGHISQRAACPN